MAIVRGPDQHLQDLDSRAQIALLRRALTRAAAAIAGLLTGDPTPAEARIAARAWLLTWKRGQRTTSKGAP